jgi:hypothetical protein
MHVCIHIHTFVVPLKDARLPYMIAAYAYMHTCIHTCMHIAYIHNMAYGVRRFIHAFHVHACMYMYVCM